MTLADLICEPERAINDGWLFAAEDYYREQYNSRFTRPSTSFMGVPLPVWREYLALDRAADEATSYRDELTKERIGTN